MMPTDNNIIERRLSKSVIFRFHIGLIWSCIDNLTSEYKFYYIHVYLVILHLPIHIYRIDTYKACFALISKL